MADRTATLVVKVLADAKQATQTLDSAGKSSSKFQRGLQTASKGAAIALAAVGAAALSAGRAAAEDAQSQAVLANAMENSVGASKAQVAAMEDFISSASMATGVADDQLRPAMGTLLRATGDATTSQEALTAALDISAATGKDVESVSAALAKGYAGNTSALGRLVPGLNKAVVAGGDMEAIMAELARTTGGAAAANAETAAGKMQRMQLALEETKESIGAALLPALGKLATTLLKLATFAQAHPKLFLAIAIAVAVLASAILALNLAVTIYTAVTTLAGSATIAAWAAALWPILLVVAAVAAVVAIVVLLWKRSQTFRTIVLAVWGAVKAGAQAMGRAIVAVWNAVRTAGAAVVSFLKGVWQVLWGALRAYANLYLSAVRAVWTGIRTAASAVVGWLKTAWSGVWDTLKAAARTAGTVLSDPFNAVKAAVEAVIKAVQSLISWLGKIKIPKINLPNIPGVGRAAAPAGLTSPGVRSLGTTRATGGSVGPTIIVQGAMDPEAVARQIQRLLSGHERRIGLRVAGP